jgi:protein-S-isoprenylcysteine O-methyltransferase Ste14
VSSATIAHQPFSFKDFLVRQRVRLTVAIFLGTLAGEIFLGCKPPSPLGFHTPWVIAGTVPMLVGLLIRSWAAGMLVKRKRLASHGPYALVRHPLYLGSILLMLGCALLTGMWWNLLICGATALISFGAAIDSEERYLAGKFGDRWDTYAAERGRLVPRSIAGDVAAFWNWKRWLKNREYNAWVGALIGWVGLLLWSWR